MAEPEDIRIENAEDREWERIRDTADQAHEDIDNECQKCGRQVYGANPEPHALNCGMVVDALIAQEEREEHDARDEPRFKFIDE